MEGLVNSARHWAVPWPCVHEFLAIVTHPRIYDPPSKSADGLRMMQELDATGTVQFLTEGPRHLQSLVELLRASRVIGPRVHDARIAGICLDHGVTELWTADRDFSYFPRLRTRNPLV